MGCLLINSTLTYIYSLRKQMCVQSVHVRSLDAYNGAESDVLADHKPPVLLKDEHRPCN